MVFERVCSLGVLFCDERPHLGFELFCSVKIQWEVESWVLIQSGIWINDKKYDTLALLNTNGSKRTF